MSGVEGGGDGTKGREMMRGRRKKGWMERGTADGKNNSIFISNFLMGNCEKRTIWRSSEP